MSGMEGFAARLRKAFRAFEDRVGRDVTQTELGELVGEAMREDAISQQSVARWFNGTLPEHPRMVALAKVLGVDPGWLSYGSGEGTQPVVNTHTSPVPTVPLEMFRRIESGDDLRRALGEPTKAEQAKKKKGRGRAS